MTVEPIGARGNLQIRRLILAPGEATAWHRDACHRFTVVIRGSRLRIEYRGADDTSYVDLCPGQADWDSPEPRIHRAVNVGPEDYEEIVTFWLSEPGQVAQPEFPA